MSAQESVDIPACRCGYVVRSGTKLVRRHRAYPRRGQPRPALCPGSGQPPDLVTHQELLQRQGREIASVGDRLALPSTIVQVKAVIGRSQVVVRDEDPNFGRSVHVLTRHCWLKLKRIGRLLPPPPES